MDPQIRFCTSADGTEIGYAKLGEGPALVLVSPWGGNFEPAWGYAGGREWCEGLAHGRTLFAIDRRGNGLSQRDVNEISLEADLADVAAVVEQEGIDKLALVGAYESTAVAIAYAVEHAEQTTHLVLMGPYARGADFRTPEAVKALVDLALGGGWSIARRSITSFVFPSGPADAAQAMERSARDYSSPEVYAAYVERESTLDVSDLLPRVSAPTLILHRRGVRMVPVSAVRSVSARIPEAKLILFEGDAAIPWVDAEQLLRPLDEFLNDGVASRPAERQRTGGLATVLFTDLVDHTEMMSRLGDEKGRDVLREHERITREVLKEHGGIEVKTMGDGFMASFGSVAGAIECAIALQRRFAEHSASEDEPLRVRIGLNAGEPIEEEGDLFGATVILAARIAAKADGGEIFVADVVRGLSSGKGFLFNDRGETELRGFEDPVRVYEVSWRESS